MTTEQDDLNTTTPYSAGNSLKRSRILFGKSSNVPSEDDVIYRAAETRRRVVRRAASGALLVANGPSAAVVTTASSSTSPSSSRKLSVSDTRALVSSNDNSKIAKAPLTAPASTGGGILVKSQGSGGKSVHIPTPSWHAPWKLSTVLSSHLGWVRSIAIDPTNRLFATGSADRTIKVWSLPAASVGDESQALQLTLTGHISPVRGLAFSPRHPYLFSCGEDKTVKCWDLETNQVVRHYHGHLSGVYCLKLHPTVDVLVTGGRDAVARVWDMRTKTQLHCLSGHEHTVGALLVNSTYPSIVTGSDDSTVKLWDLVAGKCVTTLTHHRKAVRALVQAPMERTFCSGAADGLKKFTSTRGQFLATLSGHKATINAMAVNEDGVLVSGGDDGSLRFWDYQSGYSFQDEQSKVQPGSLEAENGIMALEFDLTGTRLITGETDKTIKIYRQDEEASELSHPVDMAGWRKKRLAEAKMRY